MATWTSFYINTGDKGQVIEKLQSLTEITDISTGSFPENFQDSYSFGDTFDPDFLVIGMTQPDWVTVVHNSFDKLCDWGEQLSKEFGKVIVTMAQSVSSGYYFAYYQNGQKLREIEVCYSSDFEEINYGDKFDFEGDLPGNKVNYGDGEKYVFGFDSIEEYCKYFGLIIQSDYDSITWSILKGNQVRKRLPDMLRELRQKEKPWWKIW
jgi:hypothetical protein